MLSRSHKSLECRASVQWPGQRNIFTAYLLFVGFVTFLNHKLSALKCTCASMVDFQTNFPAYLLRSTHVLIWNGFVFTALQINGTWTNDEVKHTFTRRRSAIFFQCLLALNSMNAAMSSMKQNWNNKGSDD